MIPTEADFSLGRRPAAGLRWIGTRDASAAAGRSEDKLVDRIVAEDTISFGPFHLLPAQRLLLEGEREVRLGSRALDILIALTERPGELIGKNELMARVWRDTFVEESNLKFQVGALRRALGDGRGGRRYIATSPGQGYRFVAPIGVAETPAPAAPSPDPIRRNHNLPARLTRLIGRADAVRRIVGLIERHRLLTIVGPGGIGKTTVALAVAEALLSSYRDGAWLIDLAPLADPRLVPSALATVLGLEVRSDDPVPGLVAALRERRLLLVLDNCEHVIEAAANLAVAILKGAAGVGILATSREPLRVEGEYVQRLPPLATGSPSGHLGAAEALAFPAIGLFVERVAQSLGEFELSDEHAPIVADICRKLDGMPLAIELAAARVETFGIRGLANHLDDRLRLLTAGHRSGPPRHRTLRAMLDWSYDALSDAERAVLRRLGIFMGGFTLDAACAVAADPTLFGDEVIDAVAELIDKSLVAAETTETEPRLRLLETTRAYALTKLAESGECGLLARHHAEYYRHLFQVAETERETRSTAEWAAEYVAQIDNLRAALDWGYSTGGDPAIAVALTAAAVPLWMHLSLLDECAARIEQALAALGADPKREAHAEVKLCVALGVSLTHTRAANSPEIGASWTKALDIAEKLGDSEYQLRALWGMWFFHSAMSLHRVALGLEEKFRSLAANESDPNDWLVGERMIGATHHYLGDQQNARRHLERVQANYVTNDHTRYDIRFQGDPRVMALALLARILWLQGFPDQAMRTAEGSLEDARSSNHAISLCYALAHAACPIALLAGDLAGAEHYGGMLRDHSERHALGRWRIYGNIHQAVILIRRGDVDRGLQLMRVAWDEVRGVELPFSCLLFMGEMTEALSRVGHIAEALAAVEETVTWTERYEDRWCAGELLRVKGELLLLEDGPGAATTAEDHFRQALDWARRQSVLSWELRAAMSLARLLRDRDRVREGRELLSSVYGRFTEGFGTADLQIAKQLLDELT